MLNFVPLLNCIQHILIKLSMIRIRKTKLRLPVNFCILPTNC